MYLLHCALVSQHCAAGDWGGSRRKRAVYWRHSPDHVRL